MNRTPQPSSLKPRPRALLFDLDGLLLDTETTHIQAYAELSRLLGKQQPEKAFEQFVGASHQATAEWLIEVAGCEGPHEEITRRELEIYARIFETRPPPPLPGVAEMFALCGKLKLKRALVTSSGLPDVEQAMRSIMQHFKWSSDWKTLFDAICTGDRVARHKPAPDLYLLAVKELALEPLACVALEDSPAGVISAHAAGVRVVAVPNKYLTADAVVQGRTPFVFPSLLDVYKNFDRIARG